MSVCTARGGGTEQQERGARGSGARTVRGGSGQATCDDASVRGALALPALPLPPFMAAVRVSSAVSLVHEPKGAVP